MKRKVFLRFFFFFLNEVGKRIRIRRGKVPVTEFVLAIVLLWHDQTIQSFTKLPPGGEEKRVLLLTGTDFSTEPGMNYLA